ncbi:MAG: hypothetical protein JJU46_03070 [Balneolaceae bacterium]|nr:hypothetical protein [Balneolaceae bacterium]MCH8547832.1 hypothetical protein [Balneolaceae bacterium]
MAVFLICLMANPTIAADSDSSATENRVGLTAAADLDRSISNRSRFWQALTRGRVDLNNRIRSEVVSTDGFDSAHAVTNRLRLGYRTQPLYGFSGYVDFLDVRPIGPERYNAAGLNNQPERAVVPDPRMTVLNQLYGEFRSETGEVVMRTGRQRIIHQNARFVGNVGWRQNEQTFDAFTASTSLGLDSFHFEYNYIWQVNRIQGPDHQMGIFESDSHLAHLTYDNLIPGSRLTGFLYHLNFDNAPVLSSQTAGFRINGRFSLNADHAIHYSGSFAIQTDAGNSPLDYNANYYLVDLGLSDTGLGRIGASMEVLGSDDGVASFQTPLATLHAFQGWADLFLNTPGVGLQDLKLYANISLPRGAEASINHHWFYSDQSGHLLGREAGASVGKQVSEHLSLLVKFANFQGINALPDTRKFWMQAEISF